VLKRVGLHIEQLNPKVAMSSTRALLVARMKLVQGGRSAVENTHLHDRVSSLDAECVCRATRISGHANELHADARLGDGGRAARRKREALAQRNRRTGWIGFVAGCRYEETT
jgi:hypothetical protein